jgi:hypothetical protein
LCILLFLLPLLANSADKRTADRLVQLAADSVAAKHARDSVAVLALVSAGDTMRVSRLWELETLAHYGGAWVVHESAHKRYTSLVLDSASALINSGNLYAARGLLSAVTGPVSDSDKRRQDRLAQRLNAAEHHEREQAQRGALEGRVATIRAIENRGCKPPLRAVRNRILKNPEWPDDIIATTTCGRVRMGMTTEQAVAGWGRPQDINRTSYSFGVHEQWVYGEYGERGFLYFEDGILTTIQN